MYVRSGFPHKDRVWPAVEWHERRVTDGRWRQEGGATRLDFKSYSVEVDAEATCQAHSRLPRTREKHGCVGDESPTVFQSRSSCSSSPAIKMGR